MKLSEFTLDFSRWCRGTFGDKDTKSCAIGQYNLACGMFPWQPTYVRCEIRKKIIAVNDSDLPRKEKIARLKELFASEGITMNVTNENYGMKKNA